MLSNLIRTKFLSFLSISFVCLSFGLMIAQHSATSAKGDYKMVFLGQDIKTSTVNIKYDIPYNGVVEIRLFDQEGEKIWQHQYTNTHGENQIALKRSKFVPGEMYEYVLNYKTDAFRHSFVVPPTGFVE